jgi:sugar phosphate isomerase/epimerase
MKLGCSSWSYHKLIVEKQVDQIEWLRICAEELELDGVELLDLHFPNLEAPYLRELKMRCVELQLTISCVSVSNDLGVAEDEKRQEQIARVRQWVNISAYFGAPVLRVFGGWLPRGEDDKSKRWSAMIAGLAECAEYAEERGVVLAIENHNGRGLVGTADEVERCLREVGSPWLRLNLDTGDYGDLASIERTLPHAVHVHAKLYDLDTDGADPRFDWQQIVRILRDGRYRGFLSVEYEGAEDPIEAVPRGVRYLRRLLREEP